MGVLPARERRRPRLRAARVRRRAHSWRILAGRPGLRDREGSRCAAPDAYGRHSSGAPPASSHSRAVAGLARRCAQGGIRLSRRLADLRSARFGRDLCHRAQFRLTRGPGHAGAGVRPILRRGRQLWGTRCTTGHGCPAGFAQWRRRIAPDERFFLLLRSITSAPSSRTGRWQAGAATARAAPAADAAMRLAGTVAGCTGPGVAADLGGLRGGRCDAKALRVPGCRLHSLRPATRTRMPNRHAPDGSSTTARPTTTRAAARRLDDAKRDARSSPARPGRRGAHGTAPRTALGSGPGSRCWVQDLLGSQERLQHDRKTVGKRSWELRAGPRCRAGSVVRATEPRLRARLTGAAGWPLPSGDVC